jgi:hypothetical protein
VGRSEQIATWVIAIATAVQTLAVTGALIIAAFEWRGHEQQSDIDKRNAVLKIYSEQSEQVSAARQFLITSIGCHEIGQRTEPNYDRSRHKECRNNIYSPSDLIDRTAPLQNLVDRIHLCVIADVCHKELAFKLFCGDAAYLERRNLITDQLMLIFRPDPVVNPLLGFFLFEPHYISFIKSCRQRNKKAA